MQYLPWLKIFLCKEASRHYLTCLDTSSDLCIREGFYRWFRISNVTRSVHEVHHNYSHDKCGNWICLEKVKIRSGAWGKASCMQMYILFVRFSETPFANTERDRLAILFDIVIQKNYLWVILLQNSDSDIRSWCISKEWIRNHHQILVTTTGSEYLFSFAGKTLLTTWSNEAIYIWMNFEVSKWEIPYPPRTLKGLVLPLVWLNNKYNLSLIILGQMICLSLFLIHSIQLWVHNTLT
jgi:hypothetical protein